MSSGLLLYPEEQDEVISIYRGKGILNTRVGTSTLNSDRNTPKPNMNSPIQYQIYNNLGHLAAKCWY